LDRIVDPNLRDDVIVLRPQKLEDFVGQDSVKNRLSIAINAAKMRGEPLDHVLLVGPPGLGKTTLAQIIANEMGGQIHITSGPVLERQGDLASILTSLEKGDVLFIDEIHRMSRAVEELLYAAIEDFQIDIMIGKGAGARSVRIPLQPFTLVGATTRAGLLTSPLRSRFGMILELAFYAAEELAEIIKKASEILGIRIEENAALELGKRSRGTPRIALRLLKRVRDVATVEKKRIIDIETVRKTMDILEIDELGLDSTDRRILKTIIEVYGGGPVGLNALAATLGMEPDTISEVYEPYLLQAGLLSRTTRGRMATELAYRHLGYQKQGSLFEEG
jgi:Holliday junction DNA helicase RuvB